ALDLGKKFGLSEEDIDKIRRGGDAAIQVIERVRSQSATISAGAAATFKDLQRSTDDLARAKERFDQAWQSTIFARASAIIATALNDLQTGFINFAAKALEAWNRFWDSIPDRVTLRVNQVKEIWFSGLAAITEGLSKSPQLFGMDAQIK